MDYESGAVSASDCISEGWELIKEHYWYILLMVLVGGVIAFAASMVMGLINNIITYAIKLAMGGRPNDAPSLNAAFLIPQAISYGIGLLLNFFTVTVSGITLTGIYRALARISRENRFEFGDLFSAFGKWKECLVVAGIMTGIQIVLTTLVIGLAGAGIAATIGFETLANGSILKRPELLTPVVPVIIVVSLFLILVGIILGVMQIFVYPLIARGASGGEAFLTSIRAGFANFGGLVLLLILTGLMLIGGMLACFIGIIFVLPVLYAAYFRAAERVFGKEAAPLASDPPSPDQYGFQSGY